MFSPLSAGAYADMLARLLPRGRAWSVTDPASGLSLTLDGLAEELSRLHGRLVDLIAESDPRTTVDMLDAWERVLGLPDPCNPSPPTTTADRQAAAYARFIARGGTQLAILLEIATAAGYDGIEYQQTELFTPDISTADARLYDEEWSFFWYVWRLTTPPQGWDGLLCLLERIAPAYSVVQAIDGLRANEVALPT